MSNECDSNQISHVAVKPPPFWKHNPALWFVRLEAQFDLAKILNDTTKFNYVLSAVESDILNSVSDLVLRPPENGKYEALKKRLIEVHSKSEDSKIRILFHGLELGNQRPLQLLTCMCTLTGDKVGEPLLKSLWLGSLPNGTQTILAALNENLDQLATVADKINDLTISQGINSVAATHLKKKTAQLEQQIAQLTQQPELINLSQPINVDTSNQVYHHIETKGSPVFSKPRRLAPTILKAVIKEFEYLIAQGIIRPSKSPWASPLHVVKKSNGEYRPCSHYRRLNSVNVPGLYPFLHIQDCTQNLYGKTIFTSLYLTRAYHQIAINPPDILKTAVTIPFCLFEYTAMLFGLRNSGQTFQRHMHQVLAHLEFCIPYFDDLLIASSSEDEHLDHLHQIFSRLRDYGLR
ncbi:retrovirus-related Pol polyprotein from transposon 297 [Trichonephila clavipes]|nr:retrovirus-related Pol polyprotein from transposon 297 [Trichonephila clavipes]